VNSLLTGVRVGSGYSPRNVICICIILHIEGPFTLQSCADWSLEERLQIRLWYVNWRVKQLQQLFEAHVWSYCGGWHLSTTIQTLFVSTALILAVGSLFSIGWGHGEEPLALLIVLGTFLLGVKWIDVYLQWGVGFLVTEVVSIPTCYIAFWGVRFFWTLSVLQCQLFYTNLLSCPVLVLIFGPWMGCFYRLLRLICALECLKIKQLVLRDSRLFSLQHVNRRYLGIFCFLHDHKTI
jgi:hypothetical protein